MQKTGCKFIGSKLWAKKKLWKNSLYNPKETVHTICFFIYSPLKIIITFQKYTVCAHYWTRGQWQFLCFEWAHFATMSKVINAKKIMCSSNVFQIYIQPAHFDIKLYFENQDKYSKLSLVNFTRYYKTRSMVYKICWTYVMADISEMNSES